MSIQADLFLGHTIDYWLELERVVKVEGVEHILDDLVIANAKVRYYEMMLDRMQVYKSAAE